GGERERGSTNGEPAGRPQPADQQHALRERAKKELPPRLLELAARHDLSVSRVSVRNQRWRWGSCNRNGHICLNWRLVTMPDWVRDYVMLHELMHLERMDHSPRFWKLVKEACPEYQDARRRLTVWNVNVRAARRSVSQTLSYRNVSILGVTRTLSPESAPSACVRNSGNGYPCRPNTFPATSMP